MELVRYVSLRAAFCIGTDHAPHENRDTSMSDAHTDGHPEVARTAAAGSAKDAMPQPAFPRRANRGLIWMVGFGGVAAIIAAALLYGYVADTPASVRRNAADVAQERAQTLGEKATASQLAADQSATQSRALAAVAVKDHMAANRADANAADAGNAAAADR